MNTREERKKFFAISLAPSVTSAAIYHLDGGEICFAILVTPSL